MGRQGKDGLASNEAGVLACASGAPMVISGLDFCYGPTSGSILKLALWRLHLLRAVRTWLHAGPGIV